MLETFSQTTIIELHLNVIFKLIFSSLLLLSRLSVALGFVNVVILYAHFLHVYEISHLFISHHIDRPSPGLA